MTREGQYNGNCSLYRLWPGINFLDGIRHSVEHGNENVENYNYSSVAFFYAVPGWRLTEIAKLSAEQLGTGATVESLTSAFEGRDYRKPVTLRHAAVSMPIELKVAVDPHAAGVFLRRTFDQAQGRQQADVVVNGKRVGRWYTAEENKSLRWAEREIWIPARFIKGKPDATIKITPTGDVPFDVSEIRVLAVIPPD
jgi:hypothetical protein